MKTAVFFFWKYFSFGPICLTCKDDFFSINMYPKKENWCFLKSYTHTPDCFSTSLFFCNLDVKAPWKLGWYIFSDFLMLFVIKNKQTQGIIYSKITQEMPLISGFQQCFCPVFAMALGHNWGCLKSLTQHEHSQQLPAFWFNATKWTSKKDGGKKKKSEINLARVTKTPFLYSFKTNKSPYSGFCSPAPQLGFDTQMPFKWPTFPWGTLFPAQCPARGAAGSPFPVNQRLCCPNQ